MSRFYQSLAGTASRLLRGYGQEFVFTRTVKSGFSPAAGEYTVVSQTTFMVFGIVTSYKHVEIDGENVLSGDLKLTLENSTTSPTVNDKVSLSGKVYTVISVAFVNPAGTNVLTVCQLRIGGGSTNELR